jgi:hypothetical protein
VCATDSRSSDTHVAGEEPPEGKPVTTDKPYAQAKQGTGDADHETKKDSKAKTNPEGSTPKNVQESAEAALDQADQANKGYS